RGAGQPGAWTMGLEWRGRAGDPGIHRRTGGASCTTGCTLTATELGRCHEMRVATCICGISSQAARLNWSPEYCELSLRRKKARISASLQIVVPAPGVEPGTY